MLVAIDHIVHLLDNGKAVCAAFLDLLKAFTYLDRWILLQQLYDINISTTVLQ